MNDGRSLPLARQIMNYFVRHPNAADDLEGIVRWRLRDETIHHMVQETDAALRELVARGLLVETPMHGSAALFSLDARRHADAERFVRDDTGENGGPRCR